MFWSTLAITVALATAHGPNICPLPNGTRAPCGHGNEQCTRPGFGRTSAQFHIRDESCGLNDPNGPVYDAKHGVYHFFYQDHVAMPPGVGPVYGHVVSRDMVHWARMPVAIWNDRPYDNHDIFTGSATIVDGNIVQVYPGLCDPKQEGCPGPTNLCIAVPKNESDPLLAEWVKDEYAVNPIVNDTGRDPTTAWQTSHGEWRLSTFDSTIFGSMDFKTWYNIGKLENFTEGECPSFFPLPRATPEAGQAPKGAATPTHVHKSSHKGGTYGIGDFMSVGTYDEGDVGTTGIWTATSGIKAGLTGSLIDGGRVYASKDMFDPVKNRRINWGWAFVTGGSTRENWPGKGVETLPREVTWNPELQILVHSPIEEQDSLRGDQLANLGEQQIKANATISLGEWPDSVGNQSEVEVVFELPSVVCRVGVVVMAAPCSPDPFGELFYIDYDPAKTVAIAGAIDMHYPAKPETTMELKLSPNDKQLKLRVYVDNAFSEAYFMNGRAVITIDTQPSKDAHMLVTSTADVKLSSAKAWRVNSIWVSPEDVLSTPRMDATPTEVFV